MSVDTVAIAGRSRRRLHRYAVGLAAAVLLLITAGALVTSKGAGLSVPDWPLSYGSLNPPRWWQLSQVRAEHGHRLIAGTVALLTLGCAVLASRREPRRWVRRLAWGAVVVVLAQAALGGLTVLFLLPTAVSVAHAALAELFLALVVSLAVVTAPSWHRPGGASSGPGARRLAPLAAITVGAVYLQILVGAVQRHTGAGLAVPDFPLVFGGLVPPEWTFPIAIHLLHRLGGLVVAGLILWCGARVLRLHRADGSLVLPALALEVLVLAQIALGGAVVLTGRSVPVNTAHVATGATILALSVVVALRSIRAEGGLSRQRGRTAGRPAEATG